MNTTKLSLEQFNEYRDGINNLIELASNFITQNTKNPNFNEEEYEKRNV